MHECTCTNTHTYTQKKWVCEHPGRIRSRKLSDLPPGPFGRSTSPSRFIWVGLPADCVHFWQAPLLSTSPVSAPAERPVRRPKSTQPFCGHSQEPNVQLAMAQGACACQWGSAIGGHCWFLLCKCSWGLCTASVTSASAHSLHKQYVWTQYRSGVVWERMKSNVLSDLSFGKSQKADN